MYKNSNAMDKEKFWEIKFNLYRIKWSNLPLHNFLILFMKQFSEKNLRILQWRLWILWSSGHDIV